MAKLTLWQFMQQRNIATLIAVLNPISFIHFKRRETTAVAHPAKGVNKAKDTLSEGSIKKRIDPPPTLQKVCHLLYFLLIPSRRSLS